MKDFLDLYRNHRRLGHGFWHSVKRAYFWTWGMR